MTSGQEPVRNRDGRFLFPSLTRTSLGVDIAAGLTLAAVAIPEQLATGRLAGLTPTAGLVAFAAASLAFAALARNPSLSVGADSTIAPVIAGAVAGAAASTAGAGSSAALLALMVGVILIAIRVFRLSWLADLLSAPVGAGLMAGITVHIVVGRLPSLLNLDAPSLPLEQTLRALVRAPEASDPWPLSLGLGVAICCAIGHRYAPRWPVALVAVFLAGLLAALVDPLGARLPRIGALADGHMWFSMNTLDPDVFVSLLPAALIIAFLCVTQTLAVEQAGESGADQPAGTLRDRLATDLGALGAANLLSGLCGAFAVNSSPPRSEVARAAGARSQLTSLVAATLAVAMLFGGGWLLDALPVAALSGVLLFVATRIFPLRQLLRIFRRSPNEVALAAAAALLVIVLPVQTGTAMALMLSLLHAAAASLRAQSGELLRVPGTTVWWRARTGERGERLPDVLVFGIGAPLNFITTPRVLDALDEVLAARREPPCLIVLESAGVLAVDITGADLLKSRIAAIRAAGTEIAIARLEAERAAGEAEATGLLAAIGPRHVFLTVDEAVRHGERPRRDGSGETEH